MLHGYAQLSRTSQHRAQVQRERFTAQDQSPGRVAQHADIGVFNRAHHPCRHLFAALVKAAVDAGDDHIHLRQHVVVQVERAICQDVYFDPSEDAHPPLHLPVHLANALHVLQRALLVQPVRHGQILGVVGDSDVPVSEIQGCVGHLANAVPAVRRMGVHVHIAAQVRLLDQPRQCVTGGRLNLTQVLAQLRRHPVHLQCGIDLFLGRRSHRGAIIKPRK